MGIISHIISCLTISLVAMVLCTIRDARISVSLDREALHLVEKWLQEGPPSTTMGKGRLYLSSLWWIGPGLVGTTPDPLKECGADLHSLEVDHLSWYNYLTKSEWQRARERLDCLKKKMSMAEEEHEAFSTRVKVMGVTFVVMVLLKWGVSIVLELDPIPETLILEDPISPLQEEDQNPLSKDPVSPLEEKHVSPTQAEDHNSLTDDPQTPTEEEDNINFSEDPQTPNEEEDQITPSEDPHTCTEEEDHSTPSEDPQTPTEEDQSTPSEDPQTPSEEDQSTPSEDPQTPSEEENHIARSEDYHTRNEEEDQKIPSEDPHTPSEVEDQNTTSEDAQTHSQEKERKTPSEDLLPSSQEEDNNNTQMEMEGKEQDESSQATDDVTVTPIDTTLLSDSDTNNVELSEHDCQCNGIHLTFYLSEEVKYTFHFKTVPPGFTHSDIARIHKTVVQEVDASAPCEELLTQIADIIKRFLQ